MSSTGTPTSFPVGSTANRCGVGPSMCSTKRSAGPQVWSSGTGYREVGAGGCHRVRGREAVTILDAVPDIARYSLEAAVVLGDAAQVGERLAVDRAAAVAIDEVRGWSPLLYVCYSRWHRIDPGPAPGIAHAVSVMLDALQRDGGQAAREATEALPDAVAQRSDEVVAALLDAGADPNAYDDDRSMSALRRAVRAGKDQAAALLASRGASDDSTDIDRFIGACLRADRLLAERLLAEHPDLRDRM